MTLKNGYYLPGMDACIVSFSQAKGFSALDAYSVHWQVNILQKDRLKTAFGTHFCTYQYVRMSSGLTDAPSSFEQVLAIIRTGLKWRMYLAYLGGIVIFSNAINEHISHVGNILNSLKEVVTTPNIKKCMSLEYSRLIAPKLHLLNLLCFLWINRNCAPF